MDPTIRANLSVGTAVDLVCYEEGSLYVLMLQRLEEHDEQFRALRGIEASKG